MKITFVLVILLQSFAVKVSSGYFSNKKQDSKKHAFVFFSNSVFHREITKR